jgi:hypothetical protein
MKKYIAFLLVMVVLTAVPLAASAAVPAPEGPFNTAFRIQNLGASAARCGFRFYDASGVEQYSSGILPDIPVGDSAYIYVPSDTTVDAGQYAAVVECDQPVAAVVNFSDADSGASYSGVAEPADTLYAPGIYDDFYSYFSNIVVQNAGSGPIDISVEIYAPGNPTPVKTQTETNVQGYGFAVFEQEGLPELVKNQFYSARIIGTGGDIAAVVNIYGKGGAADQLYSYNPFASGSTLAYAPVILNSYYGYNTSLVIQNLGTNPADVTVSYSDGTVKTTTIAPGAADSRYTPSEGLAPGLYGVKVESTNSEPIVVLVNESTNKNRAASYEGFAAGSATVRTPIVMRRYYKWNSSITCQNVGSSPTTMDIEYGGIAGTTTSPSIPVNGIHLFYQPADPLLTSDNWIGSATITSAEPIVCVVNQDQNEAPQVNQLMDQLYAYDGIGQ